MSTNTSLDHVKCHTPPVIPNDKTGVCNSIENVRLHADLNIPKVLPKSPNLSNFRRRLLQVTDHDGTSSNQKERFQATAIGETISDKPTGPAMHILQQHGLKTKLKPTSATNLVSTQQCAPKPLPKPKRNHPGLTKLRIGKDSRDESSSYHPYSEYHKDCAPDSPQTESEVLASALQPDRVLQDHRELARRLNVPKIATPCAASSRLSPCSGSPRPSPCPGSPRLSPCPGSRRLSPCPGSPRLTPCPVSPRPTPCSGSPRISPCPSSPMLAPPAASSRLAPPSASPRLAPPSASQSQAPVAEVSPSAMLKDAVHRIQTESVTQNTTKAQHNASPGVTHRPLSLRSSAPFEPPPPPPHDGTNVQGNPKYLVNIKYIKNVPKEESRPIEKKVSQRMDDIQRELGITATRITEVNEQLDDIVKGNCTYMKRTSKEHKLFRRLLTKELKMEERRNELTIKKEDELTDVLNKVLIEIAITRKKKGLPVRKGGNDVLFELLNLEFKARNIFLHHVTTSALVRKLTYDHYLKCQDIQEHFEDVLRECKPLPLDETSRVKQFLESVLCELSTKEEFNFELLGIGSHHDGTKIHVRDEMDFVLRPKYSCGSDYEVEALDRLEYCIVPRTDILELQKYCNELGHLVASRFKSSFMQAISSALYIRSTENDIDFGGFAKPRFSGIRWNGPALTVRICDISVDLTIAFQAPGYVTQHLLEKTSPVLMELTKNTLKDYGVRGILVPYANVAWKVSTSWLETCLLRGLPENHIIKNTLMICKHYNERLLTLKWPCMKPFFKHQIKTLRDELLDTLQDKPKPSELLEKYNPAKNSGFEMMIYNAIGHGSCEPEDDYAIMEYEQAIFAMYAVCRSRLIDFLADSSQTALHPVLAELNNEQIRPLVSTVSAIFKFLILDEFAQSNPACSNSVNPAFVLNVLTRYMDLTRTDGWVQHPYLGDRIQVRKANCHTDLVYMPSLDVGKILNSHSLHVAHIVGKLQECFADSVNYRDSQLGPCY